MDVCLREKRLWYVRAIWVPILQKTSVEECIGEMRLNVRKVLWWVGIRATLGLDVTLNSGWVYLYYVCSGNRILKETLGGEDNGYAILARLLEVTICEEGTYLCKCA